MTDEPLSPLSCSLPPPCLFFFFFLSPLQVARPYISPLLSAFHEWTPLDGCKPSDDMWTLKRSMQDAK